MLVLSDKSGDVGFWRQDASSSLLHLSHHVLHSHPPCFNRAHLRYLACNVSGKSLSRIYCTPLTLSPVRTPGTFAATKTIYYSRTPSPSVIALTKTRILSHNTVFSSPQLSVFSAERKNSNVAREKKKIKTQSDVKSQHEVQKRTDWVENVSVRPVKLELRWVVNGHNKSYEQMCHHIII